MSNYALPIGTINNICISLQLHPSREVGSSKLFASYSKSKLAKGGVDVIIIMTNEPRQNIHNLMKYLMKFVGKRETYSCALLIENNERDTTARSYRSRN